MKKIRPSCRYTAQRQTINPEIHPKKRFLIQLVWIALLSISTFSANAQEILQQRSVKHHQIPRINAKAIINARLDEAVWQQALKIQLNYETDPAENASPPVKTEVYLYEDGETLYVGFNALDANPQAIRDYLTDRDNIWDSDFVGIKFDTFGESRMAFQFFVNALGVQAEATQEDFRGDDVSWDTIWDSAGQVTESGYVVEMAIPFKSLRFPERADEQQWGVEVLRFYPRDFQHRIANTPVDRDIACRICQFDQLHGFKHIKPSQNLRLTPTLVIGQSETRDNAFQPWTKSDINHETGVDLRWGITQDIYLNATINPDFSQVEADAAQLDINNPFTLFLEEKRPFFLDGRDYFNTLRELVYSRNVFSPDFGLKVTGQSGSHSFGLIDVNDEITRILIPGRLASNIYQIDNQKSDNQVLRFAYDLGDKNRAGVMITNRQSKDYSNRVFSFDGTYWFDQYHSLAIQYLTSQTKNPQSLVDSFLDDNEIFVAPHMSGNALVTEFSHSSRNWWGYFDYSQFDKAFRADLGFISQVNNKRYSMGLGHYWFPLQDHSWWSRISFSSDWDSTHDSAGKLLEDELEFTFDIQGTLHSDIKLGITNRKRFWKDQYFKESNRFLNTSFRPSSGIRLNLNIETGDSLDIANNQLGKQLHVNPSADWQLNTYWLTSLAYNYVDFSVPAGNLFTARLVNFRLTYQFNIRSFLRMTMQRTDITQTPENYIDPVDATNKSLSSQLLYSYKINPQTLFFAGYSDEGYQDDQLNHIEKTGRSVFLKFSYAWQL